MSIHQPVLLQEIINVLQPQPGTFFIDGTVGGGGHALAVIECIAPEGIFLGLDWDIEEARQTKKKLTEIVREKHLRVKVQVVQGNFVDLPSIVEKEVGKRADGLLLDLGLSSNQLTSGKGFSFNRDEPLVMRYDGDVAGLTAARVLSEFSERRLVEILKRYGEEKFAARIAKGIVKARRKKPLRSTFELVDVIRTSLPHGYRPHLHIATRTFLALRVFVNKELENIERALKCIPDIIADGGRVAVISFHSLEDRIVKRQFRELVKTNVARLITKKPIMPTSEEIARNPRSRSAKLRAIEIL